MINRELFPQYGRVVILDDKVEEVRGLIDLLSKQSIPFVYLENIPDEYDKYSGLGIRIIFLDLVLESATDEKTVKSILYANLTRLIKNDNGPYIIAVWSTQREHYQEQIEELQRELEYPPEQIIYLDKNPYKQYSEDLYKSLETSFQTVFDNCTLLGFLSLWENSINSSAIKVTSDFNSILPEGCRKANIYAANLARMMLDKKTLSSTISNGDRVSAAYEGLNLLLNKEANHRNSKITTTASSIISIPSNAAKVKEVQANTLLWIGNKYEFSAPKNVYKSEHILNQAIFPEQNLKEDIYSFLAIDITHKCTYFQNKTSISGHQLIYGALFYKNKLNPNMKNLYLLKIGDIFYDNNELTFMAYLGEIINIKEEDIKIEEAIFSISDEVYSEIRASLSGLYSKSGKLEF